MPQPQKPIDGAAKPKLVATLEAQLGSAMGLRLPPVERALGRRDAASLALAWLALTGAATLLAAWWSSAGGPPEGGHARLLSLNLWNCLHFAGLIAVGRLATGQVIDIVRRDILPFASDDFAAAVDEALTRRFTFLHFHALPYLSVPISLAAGTWAIWDDIHPTDWPAVSLTPDFLLWAAVSSFIYFTCTRVLVTAAFPRTFSTALDGERQRLFVLGAAESPLVRGLERLNRAVLIFWAIVFLVLATVMLLLLPDEPFRLSADSPYLFVLIPVVAFFAIGGGTLVYLESESAIRTVLRRETLERAEPIQRQIEALMRGPAADGQETLARIDGLRKLHDQILAGGRYGSRLGTFVSLALPFAMPATAQLERLFQWLRQ